MSKTKKEIIIFGTGGSSRDILDLIRYINQFNDYPVYECKGFLDDNSSKWRSKIDGVKVLGPLNSAVNYKNVFFINGIGNPANFIKKKEIIDRTTIPYDRFETIIHPTANVSKSADIGKGTVILPNTTVSSNVKIGDHVIILPNVVINHDGVIGDFSCVASGACVSGKVIIGKLCYLGTNCSIKEGISVGDSSLVGIGSVVLENIPSWSIYVGNPAKFLRSSKVD